VLAPSGEDGLGLMHKLALNYIAEHGQLDRAFVQANLGRLAPLTQPKPLWWYEFGSGYGRHRPHGVGYWDRADSHYGPQSTCHECWMARLRSLYPEHIFSNEAVLPYLETQALTISPLQEALG
jgi:hypothetical protein